MPGNFIFRPIEANLTHNTDLIGKMNPYCSFIVNNQRIKGQVCKKGGKNPTWTDAITIPASNQASALFELMDKDTITPDDHIGNCMIDLQEVQSKGQVSRWFPLTYKSKPAGEILMEAVFQGDSGAFGQAGFAQSGFVKQQENITTSTPIIQEQAFMEQNSTISHGGHSYIEQQQVVEPHVFSKAVDEVEIRSVMKEIEVLEPVKVMRDVQYTEAVPVMKQIEVNEPQVVMKEVEVMEPRVVTKQIQVIENIPIMKQVEVIESRTFVKEVDTFEPQTFTKQVEVIEQVPVMKSVTVTEPVTVSRTVDFVEPVITTKTITKEIQQPVIVDRKTTTTVGPATMVGFETNITQHLGEVRISEEQRLLEQRRLEEERFLQSKQVGGYASTTRATNTYGATEPVVNQSYGSKFNASHNKFGKIE